MTVSPTEKNGKIRYDRFNVLNESCAIFRGTRFVSVNGVHNVRGGGHKRKRFISSIN